MKGRILIINPGSTSTKIGFYEDGHILFTIELNTGETIEGTYDKTADTFKFSGL